MKETRIISIANHKGGVGKTTTTASVGSILSSMGKKVLVVDLDAQSNLTSSLLRGEVEYSIYHALRGDRDLPIVSLTSTLDLVPSSLQLAMADIELSSVMARERILADLFEPLRSSREYDYILIDCPPSLGLLTVNALTASDGIIIPLTAQVLPFKGLTMISQFVDSVQRRLNPKVSVYGVLITQWESTRLSLSIESGLRESGMFHVYATKIRKNVTIAEAPLESKNIVEYAPKSNGAKDYEEFTKEFLATVSDNK